MEHPLYIITKAIKNCLQSEPATKDRLYEFASTFVSCYQRRQPSMCEGLFLTSCGFAQDEEEVYSPTGKYSLFYKDEKNLLIILNSADGVSFHDVKELRNKYSRQYPQFKWIIKSKKA